MTDVGRAEAALAVERLRACGRLEEAARAAMAWLGEHPGEPVLLGLLGVVLHQMGRPEDAAVFLGQAAELDVGEARHAYNLGNVLLDLERPLEAVGAFEAALRARPGWADALMNLGVALQAAGRFDEALEAATGAVALRPEWPEGMCNLGIVLLDLGRSGEAVDCFSRALELTGPEDVEGQGSAGFGLGLALYEEGRYAEAARACGVVIEIMPDHAEAWYTLGRSCHELGRIGEAVAAYARALELDPGDERAGYFMAIAEGRGPGAMPESMVADLYDEYACRFDEHLKGALGYRMPVIFREELDRLGLGPGLTVLDLGCGTGECGQVFRDVAERMIGVDLSRRMVEKAGRRGVYDELHAVGMIEALGRYQGQVDLILAADVLIYTGDLAMVLAAFRDCLRGRGGVAIFSTESLDEAATGPAKRGWRLTETGRYVHSPEYVLGLAGSHGLEALAVRRADLRIEGGRVTPGDVFVLGLGS